MASRHGPRSNIRLVWAATRSSRAVARAAPTRVLTTAERAIGFAPQGEAPRARSNCVQMVVEHVMLVVRWVSDACVRTLAVFALANLLLGLFSPNWDVNHLWIQAGVLPGWLVQALVVAFALSVLLVRRAHPLARLGVRGLAILLAGACLADAFGYYRLLADGRIASSFPVPLSLVLGLLVLVWALLPRRRHVASRSRTRRALWIRVLDQSAPVWLILVGCLLHILTFGSTDYARSADAALVFGAAVRANGQPSQALRDRTRTACDLYKRGLVATLILSGGRDPQAPLSEPACMARIAQAEGVPAEALILDEAGIHTAASIRAARDLAKSRGWGRVLVVSHDYHLARIKMAACRAGLRVLTVPARESRAMRKKPWFVAREVAAWIWYYLRARQVKSPPGVV